MVEETFRDAERSAAQTLIQLAFAEDLASEGDLTCAALIRPDEQAVVQVVARQDGVLAGSPVGKLVFAHLDSSITWEPQQCDGAAVTRGTVVATVSGPLRSLLIGERTMLNFMAHLSGTASLTRRYVDAVKWTRAKILDTRKTFPGWRVLEKYAVRCGGGTNHRMGLYDGVLIKDNHIAAWTESSTIAAAVETARQRSPEGVSIEVEVDSIAQLQDAIQGKPDIILLDNMDLDSLRQCVALRDHEAPQIQLEASGGVTLATVAAIAQTGVERISVGAITHSAPVLDLAFDWKSRLQGEQR